MIVLMLGLISALETHFTFPEISVHSNEMIQLSFETGWCLSQFFTQDTNICISMQLYGCIHFISILF